MSVSGASIPVVDFSGFSSPTSDARPRVAAAIGDACRDSGFFYVIGHGVDEELQERLERLSRKFFAADLETKMAIRMELGGRAWRGYFPVGSEITSGQPDQKEGIYFGSELGPEHPKVAAGELLHGPNLFPEIAGFRETVLDYLDAMTQLGHTLMEAIALSLGLDGMYFFDRYARDPLILFRIFNYPPLPPEEVAKRPLWSVGEHTDDGILTILRQDQSGGLQVKSRGDWIEAPPISGSFVCNIGDMLDRMTGGLYRSTPHRVRNPGTQPRLSLPFFFDPNVDAEVKPIDPQTEIVDDKQERWDGASVLEFQGTYGDYLLGKVSQGFPELRRRVD